MPPLIATHAQIGDFNVSRLGYGAALRQNGRVGTRPSPQNQELARRVMRRAVALGVSLIDTADSYGPAYSETLLAHALHPYLRGLMIATKGGVEVDDNGQRRLNGRPAHLRRACEASLQRLRLQTIDLYQLHWPDPAVPFADQIGVLAELRAEGKVRHVGLCNVTVAQAITAMEIVPIAAIQGRVGIIDPTQRPMLDWCAKYGVAFIAYRPLAVLQALQRQAGLQEMENGDPAHDYGYVTLERSVMSLAAHSGATPAQIALAWLLRQGSHVIAIPGTTSLTHLEENMEAAALAAQLPELDQFNAVLETQVL